VSRGLGAVGETGYDFCWIEAPFLNSCIYYLRKKELNVEILHPPWARVLFFERGKDGLHTKLLIPNVSRVLSKFTWKAFFH